ncbi:MAG: class I SAM-dependent methyltransferase, partial [Promethearchaeota archaeon]
RNNLKLLDLGCGEGRDAVYFAKNGFMTVGLDLSHIGLEKTKKYAEETGVKIKIIQADIETYKLTEFYDVIYSSGSLHYIPPKQRREKLEHFKSQTTPPGIHAFLVLVEKPFIPKAPDAEEEILFKSGELMSYYWDWEIMFCKEYIIDCESSGIPHKHAINEIIAKRG